ncbi:putative flavin-containing amine oxidase [Chondrocystis sp. NIES-4102]|nr:putative flavin-containing amine oxidase [Chondrocystis sp. NIES-4102]
MTQRRKFLNLLTMMLMSCYLTSAKESQGNIAKSSKKSIVIIGAGLAGLTAARQLQKQGHQIIIIEARERIGGRIWTSTKWQDIPLDLGASWIHGVQGNPLTDLAGLIQAQRLITSYDKTITYHTSGQPLSQTQANLLESLRQQVNKALKKAQNQDTDRSISQAIEPLRRKFDPSSEAYRFINFILSGEIEQEYSGSTSKLSAHWYDSAKEFGGDDALFVQGFKTITDYLASTLEIELGQIVKEIHWDKSPVKIITQKSEFIADHVIITLPLGVLQSQSVAFSPQLPDYKQNAIALLGMGVLNKCYLRFPDAFWATNVDWLEYISQKHGEWTEWVSFKRVANQPILLGFNAADRAKEIEAWSDQRIVASAMETLKLLYGRDIPNPIDYQITRWASEPFSLGSYSYNAVGATPKTRRDLAMPLGKLLFFAGEACSQDYFGTAHGAYLSGLRVAKEVLAI